MINKTNAPNTIEYLSYISLPESSKEKIFFNLQNMTPYQRLILQSRKSLIIYDSEFVEFEKKVSNVYLKTDKKLIEYKMPLEEVINGDKEKIIELEKKLEAAEKEKTALQEALKNKFETESAVIFTIKAIMESIRKQISLRAKIIRMIAGLDEIDELVDELQQAKKNGEIKTYVKAKGDPIKFFEKTYAPWLEKGHTIFRVQLRKVDENLATYMSRKENNQEAEMICPTKTGHNALLVRLFGGCKMINKLQKFCFPSGKNKQLNST